MEALSETWDLLDLEDIDFLCLLPGELSATQGPFDRSELRMGARDFPVFSCTPQGGFRALAIGIPAHLAPFVESVIPMTSAMMVVIKQAGSRTFVFNTHLPHAQRPDCLQVWSEFVAQMDEHLSGIRYHDVVLGGGDLNVDV